MYLIQNGDTGKTVAEGINQNFQDLYSTTQFAYGVEWSTTVSDPHLTRIGNMSLHKTLPIQSQLRGCIAQGNKVQYWLDENDWKWRKNPVTQNMTLAVSDGVYTIVNDLFTDNRYKDQWLRINNIPCKVTAIDTGSKTATLTPDEAIEAGAYDVELGLFLTDMMGQLEFIVLIFILNLILKELQGKFIFLQLELIPLGLINLRS